MSSCGPAEMGHESQVWLRHDRSGRRSYRMTLERAITFVSLGSRQCTSPAGKEMPRIGLADPRLGGTAAPQVTLPLLGLQKLMASGCGYLPPGRTCGRPGFGAWLSSSCSRWA